MSFELPTLTLKFSQLPEYSKDVNSVNKKVEQFGFLLVTANCTFYVQNITIPNRFLIYNIINILNISNCFVNSVVYSLRIPEFRQSLVLCFTRRQTVINRGENEGRDNRGFALTPGIEPSTISRDSSYLEQDFKLESVDTKL